VKRASELLEPTLEPPAYEGVRNFHAASDVLTLAALWAMELRRSRYARPDAHPDAHPHPATPAA